MIFLTLADTHVKLDSSDLKSPVESPNLDNSSPMSELGEVHDKIYDDKEDKDTIYSPIKERLKYSDSKSLQVLDTIPWESAEDSDDEDAWFGEARSYAVKSTDVTSTAKADKYKKDRSTFSPSTFLYNLAQPRGATHFGESVKFSKVRFAAKWVSRIELHRNPQTKIKKELECHRITPIIKHFPRKVTMSQTDVVKGYLKNPFLAYAPYVSKSTPMPEWTGKWDHTPGTNAVVKKVDADVSQKYLMAPKDGATEVKWDPSQNKMGHEQIGGHDVEKRHVKETHDLPSYEEMEIECMVVQNGLKSKRSDVRIPIQKKGVDARFHPYN